MQTNIFLPIICLVIIFVTFYIVNVLKKEDDDKLSFKETFDLTGFPIITFYNNNKKLNFVLDTGASLSVIDSKVVDYLDYVVTDEKISLSGIDNIKSDCLYIDISLFNHEKKFNSSFCVSEAIGGAFNEIKEKQGISLHGLLGSDFFNKYKYVIDFNKYVAYSKK